MPVFALITALAGVVTPLGLGEELRPTTETSASFEYAKDTSPFLSGTSPRGLFPLSRKCWYGEQLRGAPGACPYTGDEVDVSIDDKGFNMSNNGLTTNIPNIIREIFGSGTTGRPTTVSNFFDIEWRQYTSNVDGDYNDGKPFGIGQYRQLESLILEDKYILVEGLIVDAKDGGVGFRNHTVPAVTQGATWQEDILFVEPEAVCVGNNLTIDFAVRHNYTAGDSMIADLRLVDHGGFANINTTLPDYDEEDPQANPELRRRAELGAWLNNANTMLIYNISNPKENNGTREAFEYINSDVGSSFRLPGATLDSYQTLGLSENFANYLFLRQSNRSARNVSYNNPFDVTAAELNTISTACGGGTGYDQSSIDNPYIACGLMRGAPSRTDGGPASLIMDHESTWSSPLHSCATAVRATVKTVTFSYNSTADSLFDGLTITAIGNKEYASEKDMPLWGFEESGLTTLGVGATWGLITPEYASHDNVSSVRAPHLYLPGYVAYLAPTLNLGMDDNYPASDFPSRVMNSVLSLNTDWAFDLVGRANIAIFTRWQHLSAKPETASDIIKLLWTDLAASAVVGTKGILGPINDGDSGDVADIRIRPIEHSITFNYLYGIPAFIVALCLTLIFTVMFFSVCFGKVTLAKLRLRLQQLSTGRIFTTFLYPDTSNLTMRSQEWAKGNGDTTVTVGAYAERSMDAMHSITSVSPLVERKAP